MCRCVNRMSMGYKKKDPYTARKRSNHPKHVIFFTRSFHQPSFRKLPTWFQKIRSNCFTVDPSTSLPVVVAAVLCENGAASASVQVLDWWMHKKLGMNLRIFGLVKRILVQQHHKWLSCYHTHDSTVHGIQCQPWLPPVTNRQTKTACNTRHDQQKWTWTTFTRHNCQTPIQQKKSTNSCWCLKVNSCC